MIHVGALTGFFAVVTISLVIVVVFQASALSNTKKCEPCSDPECGSDPECEPCPKCDRRLNLSDMQLIAPDEVCPTMGWYFYKANDVTNLDRRDHTTPCYQRDSVHYSNDKVNWYFATNTGKKFRDLSYFYFVIRNYKGSSYPYVQVYNGNYYQDDGSRQEYRNSDLSIEFDTDYIFYINIDTTEPDIAGNLVNLNKGDLKVKGDVNKDHTIEAISIHTASDGVDYQFSLLKVVYKFAGEEEVSYDL